jgi:hypothetical protein
MKIRNTQIKGGKCLGISIMFFLGLIFSITLSGGLQASAQTPNFGPNVTIISPSMTEAQIETILTNIANDPGNFSTTYISNPTQSQFSTTRNAILFLPGAYTVKAPVGYYESIAGLGATPGAVTITGYLSPQFGAWANQNSGNGPGASLGIYFWRSMENLTINPLQNTQQNGGANTLLWGVSQAAPMRRVLVNGSLELTNAYCGSSSGGFISNTVVTGAVNPCSQQQWYTRNSTLGSWSGGVWNMVFSGVQGAPAPNYPIVNRYTVLPTTPVSREKPFLYVDGSGNYNVFVPVALTNSSGTTWAGASGTATSTGNEPGYSLPISSFFIAQPSNSLSDINTALANGQNLILTPGIYQYNGSINITNPNTIVLGLGYATIVPQAGTAAITVADVDGVQIAGLLIDAGPVSSPVLMQIGVQGASRVSHASNPITINDVFLRIGGATVGTAATSMEIDSNNVILDNIWAWRADHGAGASPIWTGNAGENGVIVNGDNVTALGLFVEHYEGAQVLWNGNGGETIFYQSELPYDVPSQSAWMDGTANGYPSYVVSNSVTSHAAYGLGVYSYFDQGLPIIEDNAITVPYTPGVDVIDAVSVFLTGSGQITATVDNVGTVAKSGSITSYVPFYGVACTTTCPAAPTNLNAFAIAPTQVNLTWTASSTPGAIYTVFRSTSPGFTPSTGNQVATSVTGTSFADITAVAGTPYYYVVEASNVAGMSPASNQASATTTVNNGEQITSYIVSIDSGCANLAGCGNAANTIPTTAGQNWVYDTAAYLSGTTTLSQKTITTIVNPSGTMNWVPTNAYNSYTHGGPFTYTITGLTAGASYIVALDFNENFVQSGTGFTNGGKVGYREFNVAINGAAVLNNFDIFAVTNGANVANVQSFYTFADANGKISILFTIGAANNPTVNGVQVGTGSNMPPALVAPTSLAASSASDTQANISWDASSTSGVVYEVFRSTISGFTPSASNLITTTSGTSYVDASLLPLTTYYYLVEASNGMFTSVPSNQASVSTPVGPAASIAEIGGSGQTAAYSAEFTNPLTVIVQDAFGNLVPSASVTFAGTGVSFPAGNTAVTNTLGQAQVTALSSAVGTLAVTASVSGASAPATFKEAGTVAAPVGLTATAVSYSQINLNWGGIIQSGVTYNVYRSTTSGFTPSPSNLIATPSTITYADTGLTATTTYYYVVETVYANGASPASNQASTTTQTPNFSLSFNPSTLAISGVLGWTTLTVNSVGGFNSTISFACSGLPVGASCSFSPATLTPSGNVPVSTQLMVGLSKQVAAVHSSSNPLLPGGTTLAVALCLFGFRKRRNLQLLLLLAVSVIGLGLFTGCNSSNFSPTSQPATSTVTVTATAGSLRNTATFTLMTQ